MVDDALKALSPAFSGLYSAFGRPSIPPEKLCEALLLQVLYTVRSERMLMEQLEYNLLFRWFVGLNMDETVWVPTVFTKNRDRLLESDMTLMESTCLATHVDVEGICFLSLTEITPSAKHLPNS